jgi:hypothetical protein
MTDKDTNQAQQAEAQKAKDREAEAQKAREHEAKQREERDAQNRRTHAATRDAEAVLPRDVRPMFEDEGAPDKPDPKQLRDLMKGAERVEVVPSDGEQEILGGALDVHGDAPWRDSFGGLKLETGQDWLVHGPGIGDLAKQATSVVGYGLFVDGSQVAWMRRPDELRLGAGSTLNLKDDVVF